jgi:hypothetical protein
MRLATLDDKALVESICNCPDVRKWTAQDGGAPCVADRYLTGLSKVILADAGCFLLHCVDQGRYVVHTNLLPTCRGKDALRAAHDAMEFGFTRTDCVEALTMVPVNNPQAKWFAKAMGFRYMFTRKAFWLSGGEKHDMEYFSMSIDDWIIQGRCASEGAKFHEFLHSLPGGLVSHDDDDTHDSYVGATMKMMVSGQVKKGASIYNRWARFAGYVPVTVISELPLKVDISTCLLKFENGLMTVEEK